MNEKDPAQKALYLQMIEEDGELLKQKYEEIQNLENKFNFDPAARVKSMVEEMKRAIEKSDKSSYGRGGNPNRPNRPNKPSNPNDPFGSSGGNDPNDNQDPNRSSLLPKGSFGLFPP